MTSDEVGPEPTGSVPGQAQRSRSAHRGPSALRVLLADPQRAFVEALAMRLDHEPDVRVVAAVTRVDEVERGVRAHPVDVAVLSADGGEEDFVALGAALHEVRPGMGLVAVSASDDVPALVRAVRAGFRGWVPKEAGVPALLDVLHAVRSGETRIPPHLLSGLLDRLQHEDEEKRAASAPLASLTTRELDVLRAMTSGASRSDIADRLDLSVNTVRTHTQSILRKLGVHSSLAAVAIARRAGLG